MRSAMPCGAAIAGGALAAHMGNRARSETDQMWGLVRLRPTYVGVAAAVCILAVTMVDSLTTLPGYLPAPEGYDPAIGGALFAGLLVGRVRTMAARRSDLRTSSCTTFSSRRPRL